VPINSAVKRRFQHGMVVALLPTRGYNISVRNSQKFGGARLQYRGSSCTDSGSENISDEIHDGHMRTHTIKINNNCCHYRGNMNAYNIPLTVVDYNANAERGARTG